MNILSHIRNISNNKFKYICILIYLLICIDIFYSFLEKTVLYTVSSINMRFARPFGGTNIIWHTVFNLAKNKHKQLIIGERFVGLVNRMSTEL